MIGVDARIVAQLAAHGVRTCVIGGVALAARGYARFTVDIDLLCVDGAVLSAPFWGASAPSPVIRHGDEDDPLAGVVRWPALDVELIVGKGHAARFAVDSAQPLDGFNLPVATPLGLMLIKLEAGGMKDRLDVIELIRVQRLLGTAAWLDELGGHLALLSKDAQRLWAELSPSIPR